MIRVDDLIADLCELPSKVIGKKKRKEFQVTASCYHYTLLSPKEQYARAVWQM
jgi:hypothetical protein